MDEERLNNFDRRLRDRIDRHKQERVQTSRELFGESGEASPTLPSFDELPFDQAVAAYDDWVDRRINAWRGEVAAPPTPGPPETERQPGRRGRVQPIRQLADVDQLMTDAFALDAFFPRSVTAALPVQVCDGLGEFGVPLVKALPGYREWLPRWSAGARQQRGKRLPGNPVSRLALHIPHQATYVNGWQVVGTEYPDVPAALRDRVALQRTVSAVAAERWGHGFIEQYTEWGRDLHAMDVAPSYLIQRLGLPAPQASAHTAQGDAMVEGAVLTTTGWSLWIGEYLAQRARPGSGADVPQPGQRLRLSQLWDAFKRLFQVVPLETWAEILGTPLPGADRLVHGVSETLNWLLLNTDMDMRMINWSVRRAQRMVVGLEPTFQQSAGFSLRRALARMVFSNAEARLGVMPLPYAVLMAANLDFDPAWDAAEIRRWLDGDARQNVDARMVTLTRLGPSVQHNVSSLVSAAAHSLGLKPPEGLQWT